MAVYAFNDAHQTLLHEFELVVDVELHVEQIKDWNLTWPTHSVEWNLLDDFFHYSDLEATFSDGTYEDKYGVEKDLPPPEVYSGYYDITTRQFYDQIYQLSKGLVNGEREVLVLYREGTTMKLDVIDTLATLETSKTIVINEDIQNGQAIQHDQDFKHVVVSEINVADETKAQVTILYKNLDKKSTHDLNCGTKILEDNKFAVGTIYGTTEDDLYIAYFLDGKQGF